MSIPRTRRYPRRPIVKRRANDGIVKNPTFIVERDPPEFIIPRNASRPLVGPGSHVWTMNLRHEPITFDFMKGTVE